MQSSFTSYQKFVIAALSFLYFTVILDFMILSPLGAILMPALSITPAQFGFVVSAYAFSAGISGILAAGFADRYDRKKLLLFFYTGFIIGTLLCGLAPTYTLLLIARIITGLFGGVISSIVSAITTDLFPFEMRGRVMGFVQTSFAASQVLGLPLGIFLANHWGWHFPFIFIVAIGVLAGGYIFTKMKPINAHLKLNPDRHPFHHLTETVTKPWHLQAFATVALLSTGGFMLMPFSSAFSVHNVGIPLDQLPLVYMVTGACAMITGPLIGRASDHYGKFFVFTIGSLITMTMVIIYTRMGLSPIEMLIAINVMLFVGITSRIISSQALISAVPKPLHRGSFMAVSNSVQQISGGFASIFAGLLVSEGPGGAIEHYDRLGWVVCFATVVTIILMYFIHKKIPEKTAEIM